MGLMIDGKWHVEEPPSSTISGKGEYVRTESVMRDWVTSDGTSPYPAAAGRYHLFLARS